MLSISEAITRRISCRAFLPTPLAKELVAEILDVARWAPSGGNLQPWRVIAVSGPAREAVVALARRAAPAVDRDGEESEYPVYPAKLWEPYRTRRFKIGEDMYALLGIERGNRPARLGWFARNYEFFGAPVGLFFIIDRRMGHGQWAHLGMFMQSIALAALERGAATCMQESWASIRHSLGTHFGLGNTDVLYCGMALGYADRDHPVNRLRSERAPVGDFCQFLGF